MASGGTSSSLTTNTTIPNGHARTSDGITSSSCNSDSEAQEKLLSVATAVLQQAIDLVEHSLDNDEQLTATSTYIPGSTIGLSPCALSTNSRPDSSVAYYSRQTPPARDRPLLAPPG